MTELTWVAVNGVKPALPDGRSFRCILGAGGGEVWTSYYTPPSGPYWDNVIAYALEPVDPVKELVEAARQTMNNRYTHDANRMARDRLCAAIKAVEEME